jgi:hypothetical protein
VLRDQRGQVSIEWVGMLAIVCAIVAALLATDLGARVADAASRAVCEITQEGDADCGEDTSTGGVETSRLSEEDDPDRDGVSTEDERRNGTLPGRADSDGDGLDDGDELRLGLDPSKADSDGDGIEDGEEHRAGLDPEKADSDGDGLGDRDEVELGLSPRTDDTDHDGLKDADELERDTDALSPDTDGDGRKDGDDKSPTTRDGSFGDAVRGAACGTSTALICPDADDEVRATPEWITGEILSGLFAVGDVRDAVDALFAGKTGDALWAAVGVVPVAGDATKIGRKVREIMKRFPHRRGQAIGVIYDLLPDGALRRKALDAATDGAASRLRSGGLSDDAIEALAKRGNDLKRLADSARLSTRKLSSADRAAIDARVRQWPAARRSEALGVETALRDLEKDPNVEVLLDGRPGRGLSPNGPDIVAIDKTTGRPIVVEAKGTQGGRRISGRTLRTKVGGQTYTQTEPGWLKQNPDRYLRQLRESGDPQLQRAADALEDIVLDDAPYDVRIFNSRPGGSGGYGSRMDEAVGNIKADGQVGSVDVVDVER